MLRPKPMEQEIRFCTAKDGVRIAYATTGSGPPLVKAANWLNHLEFDWESPVWRHVIGELSKDHLLVRYDERGNGLSDWDVEDMSFDAWVSDLEAVVDAAGIDRFALLGISQGAAVSIAYATRHPERVTHLVLHGGYARGWRRRGTLEEEEKQEAFLSLIRVGWGKDNPAFRQVFASLFVPGGTMEQMDWFNELQRVTTTPENAIRIRESFGVMDVTDLLPKVTTPTLVLHSREEAAVPFAEGRLLASSIPGARFAPLESRNHLVLEQEPAWPAFLSEVRRFLGDERASWATVDGIFDGALDQPEEKRARWLDAACQGDSKLRAEVEKLLELSDRTRDRLHTRGGMAGTIGLEAAEELAQRDDEKLSPGDRVGSYDVLERIGQGGVGTVYRGLNPSLDREVAIKALSSFLSDEAGLRRFEREAKLLARLNHPGIAGIYDVVVEGEKPYLILELVEGDTLEERLSAGLLPIDEVVRIAGELVDAIEAAHRQEIVHRDLKPANVKLTEDGCVKVLDFGLAKSRAVYRGAGSSTTTETGTILGTPRYMSPEQARGETADERTDIWAFGCLLYEMLTGEAAFGGRSPTEAIASVLRDEVDFERLPATTPEPLRDLVRRCLQKEPERRLVRIGDARADLTEVTETGKRPLWKAVAVAVLLAIVAYFVLK